MSEKLLAVEGVGGVEEDGEDQDMLEDVGSKKDRLEVVVEVLLKGVSAESRDHSKDDEKSRGWTKEGDLCNKALFLEKNCNEEDKGDNSQDEGDHGGLEAQLLHPAKEMVSRAFSTDTVSSILVNEDLDYLEHFSFCLAL